MQCCDLLLRTRAAICQNLPICASAGFDTEQEGLYTCHTTSGFFKPPLWHLLIHICFLNA